MVSINIKLWNHTSVKGVTLNTTPTQGESSKTHWQLTLTNSVTSVEQTDYNCSRVTMKNLVYDGKRLHIPKHTTALVRASKRDITSRVLISVW